MDSTQLVNDLIAITSRLSALMTAEIERLRTHKTKDVEALQSEKAALARAYETLMRELRKHPRLFAEMEPALRVELAAVSQEFQRLLVRNEAALRSAKEVNGRVLRAIAEAARETQKENAGYSRSGAVEPGRNGRAAAPVSVTLNQTL